MFPFQFKNKEQLVVKKDIFSLWFKTAVECIPGAIVTILFDDYIEGLCLIRNEEKNYSDFVAKMDHSLAK